MYVYHYDPVSGAYVGKSIADPDPMEPGRVLVPAFSTTKEPPAFVAEKQRVYDKAAKAWKEIVIEPPAPPVVTPLAPEERTQLLRIAMWRRANEMAVGFGFDGLTDAITYAEEPADPTLQAKGRAFRAWRSLMRVEFDKLVAQIDGGSVDAPRTDDALMALLPPFTHENVAAAAAALAAGG